MKKKMTFAAALLAATMLSGFASAKTFVYCSEASPEGFDPGLYTGGNTFDASAHPVYNRLLEFKKGTTETEASLAESWTISDDGLVYTFKLRPGVKFQTTEFFTPTREMNADDVIFSFERQWKADNPWNKYVEGASWEYFSGMGLPDLLTSIEKVDDMTVKFTLKKQEAPFLANLAMDFRLDRVEGICRQAAGRRQDEQLNQMPLGTGPFQFVDYQQDAVIRYKAIPDYWGGKAKIDDLVFAITTDAAAAYQKLKAGECHVMAYPNPADVEAMKADPNLTVWSRPASTSVTSLTTRRRRRSTSRKCARPSIWRSTSRRSLRMSFRVRRRRPRTRSRRRCGRTMRPSRTTSTIRKRPRQLLEAAGVEDLSMKLWGMPVHAPTCQCQPCAELMQADFAKVGVNAEIVSYEWGEYLEQSKAEAPDGAVMLGWTGDNGDPDNFLFRCSAATPSAATTALSGATRSSTT